MTILDPTTAVAIGILVGAAGGFIHSILGWLATDEKFSTRKNIATLITTILTGLLATGAISSDPVFTSGQSQGYQLIGAYIVVLGASVGFGELARNGFSATSKKLNLPIGISESSKKD